MKFPILASASAVSILLAGQPVIAQQAPETAQAQSSRPVLETVLVTAQRRAELLQEAAIPINAATAGELTRVGVTDATLLNKIAPSLSVVNTSGTATSYFIRGVGNITNNGLSDSAVAFNLDGVYLARPSASIGAFFDVDRVEVLKGPQGTLYGRNATGGAINVIPNKPVLEELSGNITAGYGNYDAYELSGVINVPLGDRTALRVAAIKTENDGYYDDDGGEAEDTSVRAQLYSELNDRVNVRIGFDYTTKKGTEPGINIDGAYVLTPQMFLPPGTATTIPNWTFQPAPRDVASDFTGIHRPQVLDYLSGFAPGPLFSPMTDLHRPFIDNKIWGVNAEINIDLGGADLVLIPSHRRQEIDELYQGPLFKAARAEDEYEQSSLEARLSGSVGPVDLIGGAYYFEEEVTFDSSFNQFAVTNIQNNESETESWALFLRGTFNVTDALRLVGGVRYTEDKRTIFGRMDTLAAVCVRADRNCGHLPTIPAGVSSLEQTVGMIDPALFPFGNPLSGPRGVPVPYGAVPGDAIMIASATPLDNDATFDKTTYRVAVEFDLTPDNLLYASFETGYRSGGFNTTFGRETFDPEYIDAFTLGSKNRFFDDRFELNVEMFWWKYEDQQLSHIGYDLNGQTNFFTENVGESTIKGVEVDFQFAATESTLFNGSVQYMDATYDKFLYHVPNQNEPGAPQILTPTTGCPFAASSVGLADGRDIATFQVDCSGKSALHSPDWTVNLGVRHTINLGNFELVGTLDGQYRSDRAVGFDYLPTGNSGDTFSADASLTLAPKDGRWFVTAYVRNLTDEMTPINYQVSAASVATISHAPPRTYGARFSYSF